MHQLFLDMLLINNPQSSLDDTNIAPASRSPKNSQRAPTQLVYLLVGELIVPSQLFGNGVYQFSRQASGFKMNRLWQKTVSQQLSSVSHLVLLYNQKQSVNFQISPEAAFMT